MPILPAFLDYVERKLRERATIVALRRLTPRQLADIGLEPVQIPAVARLAAHPQAGDLALPSLLECLAGGDQWVATVQLHGGSTEGDGLIAVGNGVARRHLALGA
jgi:uncharacterized protein YjiS (DUF1127 family)